MQVRVQLDAIEGLVPPGTFDPYDKLGITPVHVHKSKKEHLDAINILGNCIANFRRGEGFNPMRSRIEGPVMPRL